MKLTIYIDIENNEILGSDPEEFALALVEECQEKLEWFLWREKHIHPVNDICIYGDVEDEQ